MSVTSGRSDALLKALVLVQTARPVDVHVSSVFEMRWGGPRKLPAVKTNAREPDKKERRSRSKRFKSKHFKHLKHYKNSKNNNKEQQQQPLQAFQAQPQLPKSPLNQQQLPLSQPHLTPLQCSPEPDDGVWSMLQQQHYTPMNSEATEISAMLDWPDNSLSLGNCFDMSMYVPLIHHAGLMSS